MLGVTNDALAPPCSSTATSVDGICAVGPDKSDDRRYCPRPKANFLDHDSNLLTDTAAVEWSKVFGSRDEDTHWTQVVPKERHDEVRTDLLQTIGLTQQEWEEYRNNIVSYRDQMVAHHDLDATVAKYPDYDVAILAANFIFDQLRIIADPDHLGDIPTSLDRWSQTVAGNMSAIVRKAFEASATLGSNVLA